MRKDYIIFNANRIIFYGHDKMNIGFRTFRKRSNSESKQEALLYEHEIYSVLLYNKFILGKALLCLLGPEIFDNDRLPGEIKSHVQLTSLSSASTRPEYYLASQHR